MSNKFYRDLPPGYRGIATDIGTLGNVIKLIDEYMRNTK